VATDLLLDANLPPSLVVRLAANGVAATHVNQRSLGQASDEALVVHARERCEILVTHDLDFSRILAVSGEVSPSVIVLRLGLPTPPALTSAILSALSHAGSDLASGAIVVVEDSAIRVRALPVAASR
jgi:predicted nuclease of predicted toxin-antitoxin system